MQHFSNFYHVKFVNLIMNLKITDVTHVIRFS